MPEQSHNQSLMPDQSQSSGNQPSVPLGQGEYTVFVN